MFRRTFTNISLLLCAAFTSSLALAETLTTSKDVTTSVIIRKSASAQSERIGSVPKGTNIESVGETDQWYIVALSNGQTGYVRKRWMRVKEGIQPELLTNAVSFKVHVIDVGTGLAVFVEGKDFTLLYDAGSQDDLGKGKDNRVLAYIKAVAPSLTTINHLILSHPHKDHLELLPDVFEAFKVKDVWDSGTFNKTVGYCNFLKKVRDEPNVMYHTAIASGGIRTVTCKSEIVSIKQSSQMTKDPITLGTNASMSILYRDAEKHSDPNENSLVTRLDLAGARILLAGDAEGGARRDPNEAPDNGSIEQKLLECCRGELKSDVLVVGHHGSQTSSRSAFIDAINAKVYVISSGPHSYGSVVLPDQIIVDQLASKGTVLRTDIDDEVCSLNSSKVGTDSDESPGGCSNVLVRIDRDGKVSAGIGITED